MFTTIISKNIFEWSCRRRENWSSVYRSRTTDILEARQQRLTAKWEFNALLPHPRNALAMIVENHLTDQFLQKVAP